jgi:hypothetical protein
MQDAQGKIMYVNKIVVVKHRFVSRGVNLKEFGGEAGTKLHQERFHWRGFVNGDKNSSNVNSCITLHNIIG